MVFGTACLNFLSTFGTNFVLLVKAQKTRKWMKSYRPRYKHYARTRVGDVLLQFKTNQD